MKLPEKPRFELDEFGEALFNARRVEDKSMRAVAEFFGCSTQWYSSIENGANLPKRNTLIGLTKLLNLPYKALAQMCADRARAKKLAYYLKHEGTK